MIKDLLTLTKNTPIQDFVDSYILDNGMYFLINKNGDILSQNLKSNLNKGEAVWEKDFKEKAFFGYRLSSNKAIIRTIQSCNLFCFIAWQSMFVDKDYFMNCLDSYFEKLQKSINGDHELTNVFEETKNAITKAALYVHEHIYDYFKTKEDKKIEDVEKMKGNRICIFVDVPSKLYEKSFKIYAKERLFLDSNYNLLIDGELIGVPSDGNDYNRKKIFIKHLTQPNIISYQDNFENVYLIYLLYKWLLSKAKVTKFIKIDAKSETLEITDNSKDYYLIEGDISTNMMGTQFIVTGFQFISTHEDIINIPNDNFLDFHLGKLELKTISSWNDFENFINKKIYRGYLYDISNLKVKNDISSNLVNILIKYNNLWLNTFKYKDVKILNKFISQFFTDLMVEKCNIAIKDNSNENLYISNIRELLLMKYNILGAKRIKYEGGLLMKNKVLEIQSSVFDKIESKEDEVCESIDEYCFAVGQLARYLIEKNKGKNVMFKELSPLLNCKKCSVLEKELNILIKKYDYDMNIKYNRLNKLISLTHGIEFDPTDKVNYDMLLCGFVANNKLFEKKENKEDNNNEEK